MEALTQIVAWLSLAFQTWAPPGHSPYSRIVLTECGTDRAHPTCDTKQRVCSEPGTLCDAPRWEDAYKGFTRQENPEEAKERYDQIATSLARVAYDEGEKAVFGGKKGRGTTAMLQAAVAFEESGGRRDVDFGQGLAGRGDGGASWCLGQIRLDAKGKVKTAEGWTGPELVSDRRLCFTAELHMVRLSYSACRKADPLDKLAVYTGGSCGNVRAKMRSGLRVRRAQQWLSAHPVPVADELVMQEMAAVKMAEAGQQEDLSEQHVLGLSDDGG
jgi:hypothetical protein